MRTYELDKNGQLVPTGGVTPNPDVQVIDEPGDNTNIPAGNYGLKQLFQKIINWVKGIKEQDSTYVLNKEVAVGKWIDGKTIYRQTFKVVLDDPNPMPNPIRQTKTYNLLGGVVRVIKWEYTLDANPYSIGGDVINGSDGGGTSPSVNPSFGEMFLHSAVNSNHQQTPGSMYVTMYRNVIANHWSAGASLYITCHYTKEVS
jgi:hypothetical protein